MFLDVLVQMLHGALSRYDVAKEYLRSRGITDEEMVELKLGYSRIISVPKEESVDYETFAKETYRGKAFEQKIIFPIYDPIGRAIGLFGRAIDTKEFKFWLTEEGKFTGAFVGLYHALPHIYETGKVFVVEGPFDWVAFRKVYKNTVGAMTAGLSDAQYEILSFFAEKIVTVFDSDKAGNYATFESQKKWKNVSSVDLGWKDPSQCLKDMGLIKFTKFIKDKVERKFLF
jgi:DNA primase